MMRELFVIVMVVVLLAACGSKDNPGKLLQAETDSLTTAYRYADSLYAACGRIDTTAFGTFIDRAVAFAEKYPSDTLAPGMLYRAGVGSMILAKSADRTGNMDARARHAKRAIAIFNQFQAQFPELDQARLCYWQRAIVYDDILGDCRSAESEYRDFITRFPNDSLTPVFEQYLTLLGKSETEISSMFNVQ